MFATSNLGLGCLSNGVKHTIDTEGHAPIKQRAYRTEVSQRQEVERQVQDMMEAGVVQPSQSPWSSPVMLVPKKDGSVQFCVDYR